MPRLEFLETIWLDLIYALRTMRKSPAFAVAAVLTLALGVGGTTAMFTVIRAVLLKPLAYRDPDQLVRVSLDNARLNQRDVGFSRVLYEDMRATAQSFTEFGAFFIGLENMALSGSGEPEALNGARISANLLRVLGVKPILGRDFLPEEDMPGGRPVALISAELWRRRFNEDPQVAGKTMMLDATPYTVVGVLPPGFEFPYVGVDVWVTRPAEYSAMQPQYRAIAGILVGLARLKPGVSLEQARAELEVLNRQSASAHPRPGTADADPSANMRVIPLKDRLVANVRLILWMLFGTVGFVLLIACANVASLLLARATSRSREFAVRAALGAARPRLIGQLLAESLLLAVTGGALGVFLAKWGLSAVTNLIALNSNYYAPILPRAGEISLDGTVLAFTLALSIATGVLFGLVPSLGASRQDLAAVLRSSGAAVHSSSSKRIMPWLRPRVLLVVGQVALSIVLLIGATLLMESLVRLYRVDPGFQPANLLTMHISLPQARYNVATRITFFEELARRVGALPGVRGAAVAQALPMTTGNASPIYVAELPPVNRNEWPVARLQGITTGYFHTLEIPLRKGREFTESDGLGPLVAIINESLARRFWPAYPRGRDPVGQHLLIGGATLEIVGIVADVHDASLAAGSGPEVYAPIKHDSLQAADLAVRTTGDPLGFVNAVRAQVLAIDPSQPVSAVRTMDEIIDASIGQRRLTMLLLGAFAGVALLLAVIGIYGVIAYSVAQRTQEFGIRRALGAQSSDIVRLVLKHSLGLALSGVTLGIGAAVALTRVMDSLLFHVSATDPATFAVIALLFLVVALAASYIPAHRSTRVDPMATLRIE